MSKKKWVDPEINIQEFEANEYVAACVKGLIACQYPGSSPNAVDDGTKTYKHPDGSWHGLCGNWAPISFESETGEGFEVNNGRIDTTRPIYDIPKGNYEAGKNYNLSWKSTDGKGRYTHQGVLKVSSVDPNIPNHS